MILVEELELHRALREKEDLKDELKKYKAAFEDAVADIVEYGCVACTSKCQCIGNKKFDTCFKELTKFYLNNAEVD
jgi:hypothetical protein